MKKIMSFIVCCFLLMINVVPTMALESDVYKDDKLYFEEIIEIIDTQDSLLRATSTRTAKKTSTCKNSSGQSLWSVTVTGTFNYNGSSATCTSSKVSTKIYNDAWKISSSSSSKSGNKATAKATGQEYFLGIAINSITRSVTLTCDGKGNVS